MPDWLWVLCLFICLTIGYFTGWACGSAKSEADSNKCPSENAYIRESEIMAEANKEIEIRNAELNYQVKMEILKAEREKQNAQNRD